MLAASWIAWYTRFLRASMLDVIHADYVRTARAKGLKEHAVIMRHAFRNAAIPLVTLMALVGIFADSWSVRLLWIGLPDRPSFSSWFARKRSTFSIALFSVAICFARAAVRPVSSAERSLSRCFFKRCSMPRCPITSMYSSRNRRSIPCAEIFGTSFMNHTWKKVRAGYFCP